MLLSSEKRDSIPVSQFSSILKYSSGGRIQEEELIMKGTVKILKDNPEKKWRETAFQMCEGAEI